jgi:hypothetical protein
MAFAIIIVTTVAVAPAVSSTEPSYAPLQALAFGLVLAAFILSLLRDRQPG